MRAQRPFQPLELRHSHESCAMWPTSGCVLSMISTSPLITRGPTLNKPFSAFKTKLCTHKPCRSQQTDHTDNALALWTDCDLGRKHKHLDGMFRKCLVNGRTFDTKKNYATLILSYVQFCAESDTPPFHDQSLNADAVRYWMQTRIWILGSSNSHASWSAALSWLCKCNGFPFKPPLHQREPKYAFWYEMAKPAFQTKTAKKSPINSRHLIYYIKHRLKIDPRHLSRAKYDSLLKALALSMIFLTMSRCMEILYSDKTEDATIRKISTGVKWQHIRVSARPGFRTKEQLHIEIPWFKNQTDRDTPKRITMCCSTCTLSIEKCDCHYLAILPYLSELHNRRRNITKNPGKLRAKGNKPFSEKAKTNLGIRGKDYVFVSERGSVLGYSFIYRTIKELKECCGLTNLLPKITPHSLRIGATSLAHHQGIDPLRVMRYVEWRPGKDPTMHARYVAYTVVQLSTIPYEILHGTLQFGEPTINYIHTDPETFILRDEVIRAALYSGDNSAMAKMRNRKPIHEKDMIWL